MIRILQTNLQRKARAHDMALAVSKSYGVDVLVSSEPNPTRVKDNRWIKDPRGDVAVFLLNRRVRARGYETCDGVVSLRLEEFRLTACYLSPNKPLDSYRKSLDDIDRMVPRGQEGVAMGDMNAKSPRWGSPVWDARGEELVEWLDSRGMVIFNTGGTRTWRLGNQSSFIDVTMASSNMGGKIRNWKILEEESLSDHAHIIFEVTVRKKPSIERLMPVLDVARVRNLLREELAGVRPTVEAITGALQKAQKKAMVHRRGRPARLPHWWTTGIEEAKDKCNRMRRQLRRWRWSSFWRNTKRLERC